MLSKAGQILTKLLLWTILPFRVISGSGNTTISNNERVRRDGGLISGPVAAAVISGMIGMSVKTVERLNAYHPYTSKGGCQWFGTSPFCNKPCPAEYDYIRRHNGRCSYKWFTSVCQPDPSFGVACSTMLGSTFYKRFCCKSDPKDCTWSGRWMGSHNAHNMYCKYDSTVGRCGRLDCSVNHYHFKGHNSSEIIGPNCDKLEMWGFEGRATCGYISWFDEDKQLTNSWYKTN